MALASECFVKHMSNSLSSLIISELVVKIFILFFCCKSGSRLYRECHQLYITKIY